MKLSFKTRIFALIIAIASVATVVSASPKQGVFAEEGTKYVKSVYVTLTDEITVNYKAIIPAGTTKAEMTFYYRNKEFTETLEKAQAGEHIFRFTELSPQYMAEKVSYKLSLYGETNVEEVCAVDSEFSLKTYAETLLSKSAYDLNQTADENLKMRTLLVDLLFYGKAAAGYRGEGADPTTGLSEEVKALKSAFTQVENTDKKIEITGENPFKTVGLYFANKLGVYYTFAVDKAETDELVLKINKGEEVAEIKDFTVDENGFFTGIYEDITLLEFDVPVVAELFKNGVSCGAKLTYSVKSNVYAFQSDTKDEAFKTLVQAVYNCSRIASDYKTAKEAPVSYEVETKNCMAWWQSTAFNPGNTGGTYANCIIDSTKNANGETWTVNNWPSDEYVGGVPENGYITFCINSEVEGLAEVTLVASSAECEKHNEWVPIETKIIDLSSAYTLTYGDYINTNRKDGEIFAGVSIGGDKTDNADGDYMLWTAWHAVTLGKVYLYRGANYIKLTRKQIPWTGIDVKSATFKITDRK